jgi:hypothetical protein
MSRPHLIGGVVLSLATLAAASASAQQVTTPVEGDWCVPDSIEAAGQITNAHYMGHNVVSNVLSTPVNVRCPIVKHTSAPGQTNDALSQVAITFIGSFAGSSCTVNVWDASGGPGGSLMPPVNAEPPQSQAITAAGTPIVIYTGSWQSATGYWGSDTEWLYAEMTCTLGAYATISNYSVTELGNNQNNTISPASVCGTALLGDAEGSWSFNDSSPAFVEAVDSPGGFAFECVLPANGLSQLDLMVGPSISLQGYPDSTELWCLNDGNWQMAAQNGDPFVSVTDYPSAVLNWTRVNPNTRGNVLCELWAGGNQAIESAGDGKIYSLRLHQ